MKKYKPFYFYERKIETLQKLLISGTWVFFLQTYSWLAAKIATYSCETTKMA